MSTVGEILTPVRSGKSWRNPYPYPKHETDHDKQIVMNSKVKNIKPMKGRVVVLPDPAPEKTESGLFIPETAKKSPDSGTVTHVSDTAPLFKVGDHVLFMKNAGLELDVDAKIHILMKEEDIYATV